MDSSKDLQFPPTSEVPLHRNAPLAPTQELAYRKKCIDLRKRLAEIETNNDATRKRIIQETEHLQKMRLLRAVLLNQVKEIMSTPAKQLSAEQLERVRALTNGLDNTLPEYLPPMASQENQQQQAPAARAAADGEGLLDDSSDESMEDEPEPVERPERRRRTNNTYRESIMNTNPPGEPPSALYQQQSTLSNLAPVNVNAFSPAPPPAIDPAAMTSTFRISSSTPQAGTTTSTPGPQQPLAPETRFGQSSPPIAAVNQSFQGLTQPRAPSFSSSDANVANGVGRTSSLMVPQKPERPETPFNQFTSHMRPQLEADNYPEHMIDQRIRLEWENLSPENRKLWDDRYEDQMREYQAAMDNWKRATRREASGSGAGGGGGGFSAINS
ncbi:hypothetical protein ABEF95_005987 [Exophiala dermatitidis]|uniref:HMG box domain-containing protein n=1 Tax=Exophiala dermatitidis (strain ATCC 34100 / CBS 525.76 / NIH/UT8656) TaxID=858893 RepID=H6C2C3_EXODN